MSILSELFALLVAFFVGVFVRRYFIFTSAPKKTGIPFVKKYNLLTGSNDIVFVNNRLMAENGHEMHKELGDTFGCFIGSYMQIFTRDVDLVYKVCVDNFRPNANKYYVNSLAPAVKASLLEARDQAWQSSRKAVGSVLKASKLKMDNVDTDIDQKINAMLASINRRLSDAKSRGNDAILDVYQINKNFFMASILKIIYNQENMVDFDSDQNDVVEEMYKFVSVNYESINRICFLIPVLSDLLRPFIGLFDHGKYLGLLNAKLERILADNLKLVKSGKVEGRLTTIHSLINSFRKGELTKLQLMGNAFFLMLAGFATTVDTMSALLWELARHPDVQKKLREDLMQYGEDSKYLQQCLNETLRLYPGSMTNRDVGENTQHKGFCLPKGACMQISIYSIHRDPRLWGQDAEEWKPDRFDPSKAAEFHPAQFIPFGIGPRNCVGYNLARLEMTKLAAKLVLNYKFEPCAETQSKLQFVPLGALPFALPIHGPVFLRISRTIDSQ